MLEKNFTFSITNQGVGPAIVKSVHVDYKGVVYPSFTSLMFRHTGRLDGGFFYRDVESDAVLKAGDELEEFALLKNDETLSDKLRTVVDDSSFHFRIRYVDVYGNCWQLDRNKTTPLGKCPD